MDDSTGFLLKSSKSVSSLQDELKNIRLLDSWTLCDDPKIISDISKVKLPIASFNHIAREVLNIEVSRKFYCDILGFDQIPRPHFESEGLWLNGYGLNLHLVQTIHTSHRKQLKYDRIVHFTNALPRVDHIAFITSDLKFVRKILSEAKVYFKEDASDVIGIEQIFLFDPDGNVIEISNCSPEIGKISCDS